MMLLAALGLTGVAISTVTRIWQNFAEGWW